MNRCFNELAMRIKQVSTLQELAGHVMDHLPALTQAPVTGFLFREPNGILRAVEFSGHDQRLAQHYIERGVPHDELVRAIFELGNPMHDMMLHEEHEWRRHPMWLEFGRRENLRHYGASPIIVGNVVRGAIAGARRDGDQPLDAQDLLTLAAVSLHMQDRIAQLENHRPRVLFDSLSRRQFAICEEVSRGLSNLDIARLLGISVDGVKAHLKQIFATVCVESRDELAKEFLFWFSGRMKHTSRGP
ncbi:hypothetical protein KEG38_43190 [Polyangium jinanense]|uniref:helix-turn-helix transcriptional regulator n=1 Tax=Polyangium jinanense TaxID=2829994 RepID=UPI002341CB6B|nr:LuxR family transcriptional regulator [Polyangium jinanense]MDC3960737.1 hypothetical protein [Polyangium jinanense]